MIRTAAQTKPGKFRCAQSAGHDLAPLCVPGRLVHQFESCPRANPARRYIARSASGSSSYLPSSSLTEMPLRFMYVWGFARITSSPATFPSPTSALPSGRSTRIDSAIRNFVHGQKTEVMRRPLILRARIAKANNEPHSRLREARRKRTTSSFPSSRLSRPFRLPRLPRLPLPSCPS